MKIFVSAWVGSNNIGDELIFSALCQKLRRRGAEPTVVSLDPEKTKRIHGVDCVSHKDIPGIARAIRRSDAVLFGGGGLLQDETSLYSLPYHLSRLWMSKLQHVPFAVIGVGAGPLSGLGRRLVAKTLRGHAGISTRDKESRELLLQSGVDRVTLASDLALSLNEPKAPVLDRIVVCLRPWSAQNRLLPVSMRAKQDPTPEIFVLKMAAALDSISISLGLKVHFVSFERNKDEAFHKRIGSLMRSPATFAAPSLKDIVKETGQGRIVISMRYHAGITALLSGRPIVMIDYSPKANSLAKDVGSGIVLIPNELTALDGLPGAVNSVMHHESSMEHALENLRERGKGNDEVLDSLLSGCS